MAFVLIAHEDCLEGKIPIGSVLVSDHRGFHVIRSELLDSGELGMAIHEAGPVVERIRRRGFNQICPRIDQLTAARVAHAHERGLAVRAWGINHRFETQRLVETGADGATVNWPDWLIAGAL